MYAVINNSMGSGSVTYECEGHKTRLSDCMSPLSSTIAPCYYALVKCFSTTNKKSGESTKTSDEKSGRSTTSGSSAGIVAGVVVSLLAVLLVVIIAIIILIVWLKRRAKNLKPADNNAKSTPQTSPPAVIADTEKACNMTLLHDNPSYQPTIAVLSGTEASNVTQLQENPSYQPITVVSAGTDASNMMLFEENPSYISTHFPASTN